MIKLYISLYSKNLFILIISLVTLYKLKLTLKQYIQLIYLG